MKLSNLSSALIIVAVVLPSSIEYRAHAFVPTCQPPRTSASMVASTFGGKRRILSSVLWYADSPDTLSEMKSSEMKSSEMKKELESYGISTKSMFDKKEFEKALQEARLSAPEIFEKDTNEKDKQATTSSEAEKEKTIWGKPKNGDKKKNKGENWSSKWKDIASVAKEAFDSQVNPSSTGKSSSNRKKSGSPSSRPERYELALEEGRAMKLSSLKKELHDRGISTSSFFEKSDLVKAYANAIADHVKVKSVNTSSRNDEIFDPSYRNVIMQAFDPSTILARDVIIDIA